MTEDATIIENANAFKMLLNQLDFARAPMNEQMVLHPQAPFICSKDTYPFK